jgi:hypothetical protein
MKRPKATNAILAAIDRLGGRKTGTKRVATLLDVTTTRVYQLRVEGVVPKADQALKLSEATGIPFEDFMIRGRWKPGRPDGASDGVASKARGRGRARSTPSLSRWPASAPAEATAVRLAIRNRLTGSKRA